MIYQDDSKLFIGNGPPWFRNSVFGLALHHFRTNYYGWGFGAAACLALIFGAALSRHWQHAVVYACLLGAESLGKSLHWAVKTHEAMANVRLPVRGCSARIQILLFIILWTQFGSIALLGVNDVDAQMPYLWVAAGLALSFRIALQIEFAIWMWLWLVTLSKPLLQLAPSIEWAWMFVALALLSYQIQQQTLQSWWATTAKFTRALAPPRHTLNHFLNIRPIRNFLVLGTFTASTLVIGLEHWLTPKDTSRELLWTGSNLLIFFAATLSLIKATTWLTRFKEQALLYTVPAIPTRQLQAQLWRDVAILLIATPLAVVLPRVIEWQTNPQAFASSAASYAIMSTACALVFSLFMLWALMVRLRTSLTFIGAAIAALLFLGIVSLATAHFDANSGYKLALLTIALTILNYRERKLWLDAPEHLLTAREFAQ
jgi:hypothetical protein